MKPGVGLIGKKLGMTQFFNKAGKPIPVTVLEAGPCDVTQVKTLERDGYAAVQLGFGQVQARKLSKSVAGHLAKSGTEPKQVLREFRLEDPTGKLAEAEPQVDAKKEEKPEASQVELKPGAKVTVELFKPGDRVDVTGQSLGKGFQGGMARWNWSGGPKSHGSMSHRTPGSIGASAYPSRVFKGQHLPGHMGDEQVTVQALEVVEVDLRENLLLVKGAVPGRDKGVVVIRRSRKLPRVYHVPDPPSEKKKEKKEGKEESKGDDKGAKKEGKAEQKAEKKPDQAKKAPEKKDKK